MSRPHLPFLPEPFVKLIDSVKRVDSRGLLYEMHYTENYYLLENYLSLLTDAGCSTMVAKDVEGRYRMGRNYDFRHYPFNKNSKDAKDLTELAVVVYGENPAAKYRSLGVADGFWMDARGGSCFEGTPDDGRTDMTGLAFLPFICMDGINEKGLAVSIMQLPVECSWEETDYTDPDTLPEEEREKAILLTEAGEEPAVRERRARKGSLCINTADHRTWKVDLNHSTHQKEPGKKTVYHTVLMRLLLDNCACTDEAAALAGAFNIRSAQPDSDYHILVCDPSGKTVILEWDRNVLSVTPVTYSTNHYISAEDQFGYGEERDAIIRASFGKYEKGMPERIMKRTLELASQNPFDGSSKGMTQWSNIYHLEERTMKLWIHLDYDTTYEYRL